MAKSSPRRAIEMTFDPFAGIDRPELTPWEGQEAEADIAGYVSDVIDQVLEAAEALGVRNIRLDFSEGDGFPASLQGSVRMRGVIRAPEGEDGEGAVAEVMEDLRVNIEQVLSHTDLVLPGEQYPKSES